MKLRNQATKLQFFLTLNLPTLYKLNNVLKSSFEKQIEEFEFSSFKKKAHLKYCRMELKTFKLACTYAKKGLDSL